MRRSVVRPLAAFLCILGTAAQPQEAPEGFSIGLGIAAGTSPYIGEDEQATPLPILRYNSERFSIGLPEGARVTLFSQEELRFSAILAPRLSAIALSDAPELDGFDREITVDGGLQADYRVGDAGTRFTFRAVTELTNEHDGQEVSIGVTQPLALGSVPLILSAGAKWQSAELAEYIWGVRAADSTSLPSYSPGEVVIPYILIGTMIPISDSISFVGNIQAEFLPGEVTGSPIIDEDLSVGALLGITYRF
ncbi:MAG: MipA/OmpV family protein [Paracoccaceae bacterium]